MTTFLTAATFVCVTAIVLALHRMLTTSSPAVERMRALGGESEAPSGRPARPGPVQRLLAAIGEFGLARDEGDLQERLVVAGLRRPNALLLFLGARTLLSVGPALAVLVPRVASGQPLGRALLATGATFLAGHLLCNYWLRRRMDRRRRMVAAGLPDCLDLMVVSLEAGLGLNATIARVGEERSAVHDALGEEFAQVAQELRQGSSREEALSRLGERNGLDELSALAGLIIQSDRLGASMAKTLRAHADVLRTKRQQQAEELARKLPIKMLIPLALFILPPLFVVTLGPALLRIRDLAHIMGGR